MKRLLLLALWGMSLISLAQVQAHACTCVDMGTPLKDNVSWWLTSSTAVFSGEAIKLEKVPDTLDMIATFSVSEFWKGDLSSVVEVRTAISGASCGYDFRIGRSYLVYASKRSDILGTGLCGGNREFYNATDQVDILGKSKIPEKKKP